MAAGDLTTLQSALQWLGLAQDDGTVARLVSAVSVQIQKFLGYSVASASYTRTFNGIGSQMQMLPDVPITAVTAVVVNGHSIPAAAYPTLGYSFDSNTVYLSGCYKFCRGSQNVQITYTAGYSTTPLDIEQACLLWLQSAHSAQDRDISVSQIRAGDTEVRYADDLAVVGKSLIGLMPPAVLSLIQPYRRVYSA